MFTWRRLSAAAVTANIILLVVLIGISSYNLLSHVNGPDTTPSQSPAQTAHAVNRSLQAAIKDDVSAEIDEQQRDRGRFYGTVPKPAGHLVITSPHNATGSLVTLIWQQAPDLTFLEKGIISEDGAMVVPVSGYYYVYSQIRYLGTGTEELNYGRIIHNVLMQKASERDVSPTTLMQNLQSTPTIRRGRLAYTTSSLGATFYLDVGSRITVNSSIPQNIDSSPFGSYFGVFLI